MAGPIAEAAEGFKVTAESALKRRLTDIEHIMNMQPIESGKARKMERIDSFRVGRGTKEDMMLAVFATLTFLITLWLCATVIAATLEQSGSKILAAIKGRSPLASPAIAPIKLRVSQRYPLSQRPMRVRGELRAAA